MKLEINLDLKDIFADGDEDTRSVSDMIKDDLLHQVKQYVRSNMRDEFEKFLESEVKEAMIARVRQTCEEVMLDIISKREMTFKAWPDQGLTLRAWVERSIMAYSEGQLHESLRNYVTKAAREYVDTFKEQYDIAFATHIVNNLNKKGLLLENAGNLLAHAGDVDHD